MELKSFRKRAKAHRESARVLIVIGSFSFASFQVSLNAVWLLIPFRLRQDEAQKIASKSFHHKSHKRFSISHASSSPATATFMLILCSEYSQHLLLFLQMEVTHVCALPHASMRSINQA